MKRVSIVNGLTKSRRYNDMLGKMYEKLGYKATFHKFNSAVLFCCHLHKFLDSEIKTITDADVIHCQSGGYFRVLHYMEENRIRKPLILESPVLKASTGTFFAALGRRDSFHSVEDNNLIQFFLDSVCFTPTWTARSKQILQKLNEKEAVLLLHSDEDKISDIRGLEHLFQVKYKEGAHARLFNIPQNDFKPVESFIKNYRY